MILHHPACPPELQTSTDCPCGATESWLAEQSDRGERLAFEAMRGLAQVKEGR